jgi:predicted DNA-binding protein
MGQRVNHYMSDVQIKKLKKLSKKTGLSVSELIRRAIDEYLERFEKK